MTKTALITQLSEPILLWAIKNAFTQGLKQAWMIESPAPSEPRAFRPKELDAQLPWFNYRLGKDVFLTKEAAVEHLEVLRKTRILRLRKSIKDLELLELQSVRTPCTDL